jgi:Septum formation initiator
MHAPANADAGCGREGRLDGEPGDVAGRATKRPRAYAGRKRARFWQRRLRLVGLVVAFGAAVYLYYQPIASYLETRNELAAERAEVETLRVVKAELELRLVTSTSVEATRREARRIGFVLPGEQLFVVKGIPAWRRAQRTLGDDG